MEATANWDDVLQKSSKPPKPPKSPKSPKSDGWFSRKSPKSDGRFSQKSPKSDGWVSRKLQGRKRFPVLNPAAVKLWKPFQAFSLQNPYGQCAKCKEYTHNTEDHDAVIALAKKRNKTAKSPKAIIISPFICLDEGMRHGHVFNEEIFRKAWNIVRGCINVVPDENPDLYGVFTRGEEIRESDGTQRVYRDDWQKCCPEEVKAIARAMTQEFMQKGVTMRFALVKIELLYDCICYAVIRIYLDMLEWEDVHNSPRLAVWMDYRKLHGVKTNGERLVRFIAADDLICKKMRLGQYLSDLVNAVRHELVEVKRRVLVDE